MKEDETIKVETMNKKLSLNTTGTKDEQLGSKNLKISYVAWFHAMVNPIVAFWYIQEEENNDRESRTSGNPPKNYARLIRWWWTFISSISLMVLFHTFFGNLLAR